MAGSDARVLLLLPRLDVGGTERQFALIANTLHARGARPVLVTLWPGGALEGELDPGLERRVLFPARASSAQRAVDLLRASAALTRVVEAARVDLVLSGLYIANAIAHRATRGRAEALVWRLGTGRQHMGWKRSLPLRYCRRVSADVALAISNSTSGLVAHEEMGFRFARSVVIQNGVDVERFAPAPAAGARLRAELGLAEDARVVGFAGRLSPVKDLKSFLGAAARTVHEYDDAHFLFAGPGSAEELEALRARAEALGLSGRTHFLGPRDDLPAFYSSLALFALTSRTEGTPNALLEALACGTPCTSTDVGDCGTVLGDPERLAPSGDVAAIAQTWSAVLALPRASRELLREASRARVLEHFGPERMVEEILEATRALRH